MDNNNKKLTAAASEAVDEIVNEYRSLLVTTASNIAKKDTLQYKEITLKDVLEAKDAILYPSKGFHKNTFGLDRKTLTVLLLFSFATSFLIICSLMMSSDVIAPKNSIKGYEFYTYLVKVRYVVLLFVLTMLPFIIYLILEFLKARRKGFNIFESEIISRWQVIENLGNTIINSEGGNAESKSFGSKLQYLKELLYHLDQNVDLMKLLDTRNKALHEGYQISRQELMQYITQADQIIDALEKYETQNKNVRGGGSI